MYFSQTRISMNMLKTILASNITTQTSIKQFYLSNADIYINIFIFKKWISSTSFSKYSWEYVWFFFFLYFVLVWITKHDLIHGLRLYACVYSFDMFFEVQRKCFVVCFWIFGTCLKFFKLCLSYNDPTWQVWKRCHLLVFLHLKKRVINYGKYMLLFQENK